jgi:hypothetical protein
MDTETPGSTSAARLRWLLVVGLLVANVVLLAMGSLAAALGGGLSSWGNGAGGLNGWADLSQTIFSLVIGVAAGVATFREGRAIPVAVAVFATGLLIGVGYLIGGHLMDPCDRGWWDARSRIGDQPLCERFGLELSVHTRFHLLLHATLGVLSCAVAVVLYRRTRLIGWWPPERV